MYKVNSSEFLAILFSLITRTSSFSTCNRKQNNSMTEHFNLTFKLKRNIIL